MALGKLESVYKLYDDAFDLYELGLWHESLAALKKLQEMEVAWLRPFLLEAYVLRQLACPMRELQILYELLGQAEQIAKASESDNDMTAEAWSLLGESWLSWEKAGWPWMLFCNSPGWSGI